MKQYSGTDGRMISVAAFFKTIKSVFWQPGEGCFLFRKKVAGRVGKLSQNALPGGANRICRFVGFFLIQRIIPHIRKINQAAYDLDITIHL